VRLAWFSPWPPERSGIATCSADVVPALAARGCGIDVFVDAKRVPAERASDEGPAVGTWRVLSAHDFVWRVGRGQYDLAVYQIGNSKVHDFTWPYLFEWPGLVVLHETRLHHARGHALLLRHQKDAYRREFAWNHPEVSPDAAELGVFGFDGPYYYLWPMTRRIVESARLVATHTPAGAAGLAAAYPDVPVDAIALGHGRDAAVPPTARAHMRARLGVSDHHVLFGAFGALTAEKRIPEILRAFAHVSTLYPHARLLLAGAPDAGVNTAALVDSLGLADRVITEATFDDEAFDAAIAATDATLNLRWPTSVEMSGPWLRALAAARPTITLAVAHMAHVPALDPRDWLPITREDGREPVTIALDLVDEEHSMRLAMERLAIDAGLRASLGAAARRYWESEHTVGRMTDDYLRVIRRATAVPAQTMRSPLLPDSLEHARALLAPFGQTPCA
jgi:glycosyltransferase involved in cell wall biosynthesis